MMKMKVLVIFKVGETFSDLSEQIGDFDQWIIDRIGPLQHSVIVVDPRGGDSLPESRDVAAAIVTGSHAMVTDRAPWSENLAAWFRSAIPQNIPVLGICYGHQLLAHALGGDVGFHPGGIELGTVSIRLTSCGREDPLLGGMPDEFLAQAVHRQSVLRLPEGAVLLASNAFEPHHAFRVGDSAWGVQFHPEFSPEAMVGYVRELTEASKAGVPAPEVLPGKVFATDHAASILPKFANLVRERIRLRK